MQAIKSNEIDSLLGELSFWSKVSKTTTFLKYLKGAEEFDNEKGFGVTIQVRPKGILLSFNAKNVAISYSELDMITIMKQEHIYEAKSKSVVGRALLGGLLFGGVGALVGAASGTGTNQKRIDSNPDNVLVIRCHNEGIVYLEVSDKQHLPIKTYLKDNLNKYFKESFEL